MMMHTDARFELTIPAPKAVAFPFFGGWGERAWAGDDWQPSFLHPAEPHDEEGAVFTLEHGLADKTVWVNSRFDLESGRVQYVYVSPGVQAVLIDLTLHEVDEARTHVRVRYRRTALNEAMNERVKALGEADARHGPDWEAALCRALAAS